MSAHIGSLVRKRLQDLGMTKSEFARRINTTPQNVNGILKRKSLDTELLHKISQVLDYDFFSALTSEIENPALEARAKYRTGGKKETVEDLREAYESCLRELESLKRENQYLRELNELLKEKARQQG